MKAALVSISRAMSPAWTEATASLADFFALMKPRVMSLAVFTSFVGLLMAPAQLHPLVGLIAILAIAGGAGAAGVLNMW
jgi:protoheme IX farnesyltransferase